MPIPLDALKQANGDPKERIVELLRTHPDQAYSEVEIFAYLKGMDEQAASMLLSFAIGSSQKDKLPEIRALNELVKDRVVEQRQFQGRAYFYIAKQSGP